MVKYDVDFVPSRRNGNYTFFQMVTVDRRRLRSLLTTNGHVMSSTKVVRFADLLVYVLLVLTHRAGGFVNMILQNGGRVVRLNMCSYATGLNRVRIYVRANIGVTYTDDTTFQRLRKVFQNEYDGDAEEYELQRGHRRKEYDFKLYTTNDRYDNNARRRGSFRGLFRSTLPDDFPTERRGPGTAVSATAVIRPANIPTEARTAVPAGTRLASGATRRVIATQGFLREHVTRETKGVADTRVDERPAEFVTDAVVATVAVTVDELCPFTLIPATYTGSSSGIATGVLL